MMEQIKQWMYYFIIGIISLIALIFLPMVGSAADLAWNVPNTFVGWVVWIAVKCIVATIGVLIFHCFMLQAKLNVKDNERYIEANTILENYHYKKERIPRSPQQWNKIQYGRKGICIFVITLLSTIALTQALLTFDYMSMLVYLFTIVMNLIFGILQMKSAEGYWTEEYWEYAQRIKKLNEEEQQHVDQVGQRDSIEELGGTSPQEQTGYCPSL